MASREEIEALSIEELCDFLQQLNVLSVETVASLRINRISGAAFLELSNSDLREIVPPLGDRKEIEKIIYSYVPKEPVSHFTA